MASSLGCKLRLDSWFALGNLMSNVTLKAMADTRPQDWKTPIYTQFGMIGASIIIFFFLPESACKLMWVGMGYDQY